MKKITEKERKIDKIDLKLTKNHENQQILRPLLLMDSIEIKARLLEMAQQILSKKRVLLEDALKSLQESLQSEAKSSAGDKHETGRAMIQLEQEKLEKQLFELETQLKKIDSFKLEKYERVKFGSIVKTNSGNYFILSSIGKLEFNNEEFMVISGESPLAKSLNNSSVGDKIEFNGRGIEVLELF